MTHFRPLFPPENKMPIPLAQWFPRLQWTHRSHWFFHLLRVARPDSSAWPTPLPRVQRPSDTVQGGDWGKHLPPKNHQLSPASPAPYIHPPQDHHRDARASTRGLMGREGRTQRSPPPSDETTVAPRSLARPTDVHVGRRAAMPNRGDSGSRGGAEVHLPRCEGGHPQPCPWRSSKGTLPTASIFW